jgi:hypothetical protein
VSGIRISSGRIQPRLDGFGVESNQPSNLDVRHPSVGDETRMWRTVVPRRSASWWMVRSWGMVLISVMPLLVGFSPLR